MGRWWGLLLALALCWGACAGGQGAGGVEPTAGALKDHTVLSVASVEQFERLARRGHGVDELKFIIVDFADARRRQVRFLDANFYRFHDEWYWHQLLNGHFVPGADVAPGKDLKIDHIVRDAPHFRVQYLRRGFQAFGAHV